MAIRPAFLSLYHILGALMKPVVNSGFGVLNLNYDTMKATLLTKYQHVVLNYTYNLQSNGQWYVTRRLYIVIKRI